MHTWKQKNKLFAQVLKSNWKETNSTKQEVNLTKLTFFQEMFETDLLTVRPNSPMSQGSSEGITLATCEGWDVKNLMFFFIPTQPLKLPSEPASFHIFRCRGILIAACCSGSKLELFNSHLVHGGIGQLSSMFPPQGFTWYHSLRLFHTMDLTKVKPPTDDPIMAIKSTNNRLLSCIRFMISHYILPSGSSYHMSLFKIRYPKLDPLIGRPVLLQHDTGLHRIEWLSNSKVRSWPFSGRHSLPCKVSCDRRCLWLKLTSPKQVWMMGFWREKTWIKMKSAPEKIETQSVQWRNIINYEKFSWS